MQARLLGDKTVPVLLQHERRIVLHPVSYELKSMCCQLMCKVKHPRQFALADTAMTANLHRKTLLLFLFNLMGHLRPHCVEILEFEGDAPLLQLSNQIFSGNFSQCLQTSPTN